MITSCAHGICAMQNSRPTQIKKDNLLRVVLLGCSAQKKIQLWPEALVVPQLHELASKSLLRRRLSTNFISCAHEVCTVQKFPPKSDHQGSSRPISLLDCSAKLDISLGQMLFLSYMS